MRIARAVFIVFFLSSACPAWADAPQEEVAAVVKGEFSPFRAEAGFSAEQAQGSADSAPLLPPDATQAERLKTVVNLSFTNANLKNVLSSLAKIYGLNIVADDAVAGTVTLTLRGVTLEEGLRQMLKRNGFGFSARGEILEVSKLEAKRGAGVLMVNYIDLDTALEFLQPMASQGAVLKVDETSNGILVSDYMSRIEEMRALLKEIDQPPQQVFIESKLMDITHNDLDNLGLALSSVSNTLPLKAGSNPLDLSSGAFSLAGPSSTLLNKEFQLTIGRGSDSITASLNLLIQNKKVKVIANPTVLTLNNSEARIIIGEKFPIREQMQTTTGTLETTRFVDVGTALRVTPRINPGGTIQLHIHPEVSSVSATLEAGPRITTREADTTVVVKNGEPVVIGGLIQQDETLIRGRIPFLGHVPFLGLLFQNRSKDHQQKELVIVITPHIVKTTIAESNQPYTETHDTAVKLDVLDLFSQAKSFEEGTGIRARQTPETLRNLQAVDLYQRVADRFPTHPYAMESLWRMGLLTRDKLYDLDRSEEAFRRLVGQFPDSKYRNPATRQIKEIVWQREQIAKRGIKVKALASGQQQKSSKTNIRRR